MENQLVDMQKFKQHIMKNLANYITEAKNYFKLESDERDALATLVGIICGNLGEDEEIKFYKDLFDSFSDKEKDQLNMLHDVLEDTETYKQINRNNIKNDIPLLKKIYTWMSEKDAFKENWDLIDVLEKINEY